MEWLRRIQHWWGSSLRRRLLLSNTMVILLFVVLLGTLSYRLGQIGVREEVIQRNDKLANLVAEDINSQLDNMFDNVRLFTYQLEATSDMLPLQARAMLEFRRASPLTYRALYLYDDAGNQLIHVSEPLEELLEIKDVNVLLDRPPVPISERALSTYEMARQGNMFLAGAALTEPDRVPIIYMGVPLVVDQRGPGEVVVAEIDLRAIWRRIDEIHIGETGRAYVVSQDGTIIAHPDRAYVGDLLPGELKGVLEGDRGHTRYVDNRDGREKYASFSPVGSRSGWGVVVEQDSAEALARVNRIITVTVAVLAGAMVISFLLTILTARSVAMPIGRLVDSTRRIADTGDLSHQVDLTTTGEVGQLAAAFNQMILRLRRAQSQVMQLNRNLERRVEERTTELQESEARYRAIVEDQTELIWRVLPDGTFSFANEAFCRYFGRRREDLIGHSFLLFVKAEDVDLVEQAIQMRSTSDPVDEVDFRVELNDGRIRWHRWTLRVITDDSGAVAQVQGVGRDVTDERRAQAALREAKETAEAANRAKGEFLASMSHELRTPLNAVLGLSEALQEEVYGPVTEKQAQSLATIEASGRHLLSLINDILDVSRTDSDSLQLEPAEVQVMGLCQASLDLIGQAAEKKNLQVEFEAESAPSKICADERRLIQILVNLLGNAVKFTEEGGRVGLQVAAGADDGIVCFTVWDTGIGISEPDMRKLFRPFVQLDSGLSRRFGGAGLGLLLAYRLAERHGGSIGVESVPGKGSRFTVWLPTGRQPGSGRHDGLQAADLPAEIAWQGVALGSDKAPGNRKGEKLLVVDRMSGKRADFVRSLRAWGYDAKLTRGGADVHRLVQEWTPDLSLIYADAAGDVLDTITHLRGDAAKLSLPLVACVSLVMPGDEETLRAEGVTGYLRRPVTSVRLKQVIERLSLTGDRYLE